MADKKEEVAKEFIDWIKNEGLPNAKNILEELKEINKQKELEKKKKED